MFPAHGLWILTSLGSRRLPSLLADSTDGRSHRGGADASNSKVFTSLRGRSFKRLDACIVAKQRFEGWCFQPFQKQTFPALGVEQALLLLDLPTSSLPVCRSASAQWYEGWWPGPRPHFWDSHTGPASI